MTARDRCFRKTSALLGTLLALSAGDGAFAAASVSIGTSNANPVAGGAAFSYTITISSDALGAVNVRMTDPLPSGALFQNLSISGPSAGAFHCLQPPVGTNGLIACDASLMLASTSATVTIVASFAADLADGVRTNIARVVSDVGAAAVTAQVQQTVQNTSTLATTSDDGASGSMWVRRLTVTIGGSGSRLLPIITSTLPASAYVAWLEPTGGLVDSCSFDAITGNVQCLPRALGSGAHRLTIVYGLPPRLFRDGFE
jgi:hypothetical protein